MLVIRAGIQKMLVSITNKEDPDQTASLEYLGLPCLSKHSGRQLVFRIFGLEFTIYLLE